MGLVNSRVDGSVMFRVITPELTLDQRATLLGFHGKNARVMVEPLDVPTEGLDEVTTEMDVKTPAQRLRAVSCSFTGRRIVKCREISSRSTVRRWRRS